MTDWHRIDDPENQPPKDGTEVLIYQIGAGALSAFWSESIWAKMASQEPNATGAWVQEINRSDTFAFYPTHWVPLPPPPVTP